MVTCTDAFGSGTGDATDRQGHPVDSLRAPTAHDRRYGLDQHDARCSRNGACSAARCRLERNDVQRQWCQRHQPLDGDLDVPLTLGLNTLTATCTNAFGTGTTVTYDHTQLTRAINQL